MSDRRFLITNLLHLQHLINLFEFIIDYLYYKSDKIDHLCYLTRSSPVIPNHMQTSKRSHLVLFLRLVVELREEGIWIFEQLLRIIVLFERSALKHKDTVRVDDGVQPVRDSDDRTVLECLVHRLVYH